MSNAKYIGRVGALAVAVGVGIARLCAGSGVRRADELPDTTSSY